MHQESLKFATYFIRLCLLVSQNVFYNSKHYYLPLPAIAPLLSALNYLPFPVAEDPQSCLSLVIGLQCFGDLRIAKNKQYNLT